MKQLCDNCGREYETNDTKYAENPEWGNERPQDKREKKCPQCLEDLEIIN